MTDRDFIYYLCGRLAEIKNLKKIESQNINEIISFIDSRIKKNNLNDINEISDNYAENDYYEESSDEYMNEIRTDFRNKVNEDIDLDQQVDIW